MWQNWHPFAWCCGNTWNILQYKLDTERWKLPLISINNFFRQEACKRWRWHAWFSYRGSSRRFMGSGEAHRDPAGWLQCFILQLGNAPVTVGTLYYYLCSTLCIITFVLLNFPKFAHEFEHQWFCLNCPFTEYNKWFVVQDTLKYYNSTSACYNNVINK
jgi:hypothetical protein